MVQSSASPLLNSVKDKLALGGLVASMSVRLVSSVEIVMLAKAAGFDCLYVDLEHSSFSIHAVGQIAVTGLAADLPCLVRVPANTPDYIARVLDAGALGIVAPDVRSAQEARAVVAAIKFPPMGVRGVSGPLPHLGYRSIDTVDTFTTMNKATLVIVQIEAVAGVEACDEILAVPGVDMALVGTNDLLADMGIPGRFDDPVLEQSYATVQAACTKHGKFLGIGGLSGRQDLVAKFVRNGGRFVSTGTDIGFLLQAATVRAEAVKSLLDVPST